MRTLKGYRLLEVGGNKDYAENAIASGTSIKIGSSLMCHLLVKEAASLHCVIAVNEISNQVEVTNFSSLNPIMVNKEIVLKSCNLRTGDEIQILQRKFKWGRNDQPKETIDLSDDALEASYQIEVPVNHVRGKSEPRLLGHKWLPQGTRSTSYDGQNSCSSSEDDEEKEVPDSGEVENKENLPTKTDDTVLDAEIEDEKTLLNELNHSSNEHTRTKNLIDLATPESSKPLIDLATPADTGKGGTTPKQRRLSKTLLRKVLTPRISMSTVESDFKDLATDIHSTPMVNKSGSSSLIRSVLVESKVFDDSMEGMISGTTTCSEQSTVISKTLNSIVEEKTTIGTKNLVSEESRKMVLEEEETSCEFVPDTQHLEEEDEVEMFEEEDNDNVKESVIPSTPFAYKILSKSVNSAEFARKSSVIPKTPFINKSAIHFHQEVVDEDDDDDIIPATPMVDNTKMSVIASETESKFDKSNSWHLTLDEADILAEVDCFSPAKKTPKKVVPVVVEDVEGNSLTVPDSEEKIIENENEPEESKAAQRVLPNFQEITESIKMPGGQKSVSKSPGVADQNLTDGKEKTTKEVKKTFVEINDDAFKDDDEIEIRNKPLSFTPRKSLRTPKKIDTARCCTPKSLAKVIQADTEAVRKSNRVSRVNLLQKIESSPVSQRKSRSNLLSKSLVVSKLPNSSRKRSVKVNHSMTTLKRGETLAISDSEDENAEPLVDDKVAEEDEKLVEDENIKDIVEVNEIESVEDSKGLDSEGFKDALSELDVKKFVDQFIPENENNAMNNDLEDCTDNQLYDTYDTDVEMMSIVDENIKDVEENDGSEDGMKFNENADKVVEKDVNVGTSQETLNDEDIYFNKDVEKPIEKETNLGEEDEDNESKDDEDNITQEDESLSEPEEIMNKMKVQEHNKKEDLKENENDDENKEDEIQEIESDKSDDESGIEELSDEESIMEKKGVNPDKTKDPLESSQIYNLDETDVIYVGSQDQTTNQSTMENDNDSQDSFPNQIKKENQSIKETKEIFIDYDSVILEKTLPINKTISNNITDSPVKTPTKSILNESERLVRSPLQNLSNTVRGTKDLFGTPKSDKERSIIDFNDRVNLTAAVYSVTEIVPDMIMDENFSSMVNSPKAKREAKMKPSKEENFVGVKEMLKTPRTRREANLVGVKEMMLTPKTKQQENMVGVKELMKTPSQNLDVNMVGVKEMLKTPVKGLDNLVGVKELMATPQMQKDVNLVGVREMMKTPAVSKSDEILSKVGLRDMLKTPKPQRQVHVEGLDEIFKTPAPLERKPKRILSEESNEDREDVIEEEVKKQEELTKNLKAEEANADLDMESPLNIKNKKVEKKEMVDVVESSLDVEVKQIENTEMEDKSSEERENLKQENETEKEEEPNHMDTSDEMFDKLVNKKTVKNTYSRKNTPKKPEEKTNLSPEKTELITNWVESLIQDEKEVKTSIRKKVNNNLQVLSDRYSNVTPQHKKEVETLVPREPEEEEIKEVEEDLKVDDDEIEVKPRRGRRPAIKPEVSEEVVTPRKTRRNLKKDLDGTPAKVEEKDESVVKTPSTRGRPRKVKPLENTPLNNVKSFEALEDTPSRLLRRNLRTLKSEERQTPTKAPGRGRKAKKEEGTSTTENSQEETANSSVQTVKTKEDEQQVVVEATRGRKPGGGRQAALKKQDSELTQDEQTPVKRGRKPKVVEEKSATDKPVEEIKPTRGRKAAVKKTDNLDTPVKDKDSSDQTEEPIAKPETPKPKGRRGRKPIERTPSVVSKPEETETESAATDKEEEKAPAKSRGRKRAVAKVEEFKDKVESEDSPAKKSKNQDEVKETNPKIRGRKPAKKPEDDSPKRKRGDKSESDNEKESESSATKKQKTDDEKKKPTRGKKAAKKTEKSPEKKTDDHSESEDEPKKKVAKNEVKKEAEKPTRGRKNAKTAKEVESESEQEKEEEVVVKKPTRGRPKIVKTDSITATPTNKRKKATEKETNPLEESVTSSTSTRSRRNASETPRGRKEKAAESESEKEPTTDESTIQVETKGRRNARAKKMDEDKLDEEKDLSSSTTRSTRTRRKN